MIESTKEKPSESPINIFIRIKNPQITGIELDRKDLSSQWIQRKEGVACTFSKDYDPKDFNLSSLAQALKATKKIKKLGISFERKRMSDRDLKKLCRNLRALIDLQELHLDFPQYWVGNKSGEVSDEGIMNLGKSMENLTSLTNLTLSLSSFCSDLWLNYLGKGIRKLNSLICLKIEFIWIKITDKGFHHLGNSLKLLTSLKKITILFYNCGKAGSEGFSYIGEGLKGLTSLEELSFTFASCDNINDEGIKRVSKNFKSLTSVCKFALYFKDCNNVTNTGLLNLGENLEKVTSFNILLNFLSCDRIDDSGIVKFGESLKKNTSIETLVLGFTNCKGITSQGREDLIQILESHPSNMGFAVL